jgi:3-deoxy-D-manno-octulosonic-acid transferase
MILLYRILTTFLYPILILAIFFRKIKKKEDAFRYKEKIFPSCFNVVRNSDSKLIWFHAASIGEFKSILPIIEEINNNYNHIEFLITTVTLSSSNLAKEELKKFNNVQHRFFPLDVGFLMNKFFSLWKPNIIFLVDSEIWPNLIFRANKNKIPLSLINARITSKTFKRWMIFPRTAKKIFSSFSLCLTSNLETKNYLLKFNKENIYFNGNIKLINKIDAGGIKNLNEKFLLKNRFWLAASTHKGEEVFCLQTHIQLRNKYKDIVTIIAPRHIERVKSIKRSCDDLNLNVQIINKNEPILDNKEIIIINSFGILSNYFKYAKSVFIGKSTIKSLENVGGQNPIDAAKLGCKIYHGPYVYNFKEVYEILKKIYISEKIENTKELSDNLIKDLEDHRKDNKKISVLINNLGQKTLADTMNKINNFLLNEIK